MKFGHITWETFFLKNHTQNVVEKLFPGPFLKIQNWAYLWINILKFYIFCFTVSQVEDYRKWLKLSYRPLASGTSLPALFSAWCFFLHKNISVVIFYCLIKFQCLVTFTSWDIGQFAYCRCLLTRLWHQKFWN